jgi:hypothetical protein
MKNNKTGTYILWGVLGLAVIAGAAILLLNVNRQNPPPSFPVPDYWPTEGWRESTPEEQGIDSGKLADALLAMREQRSTSTAC